jgi:hypothetical protein
LVFDGKYQFLLNHFSEEVIARRYATWLDEIQKIVNRMGMGDYFYISEDSLSLAVLDYFTDIARLKPFQDIEHTNVQKIYAYGVFWLLRRSPIQTVAQFPQEFAYINEKTMILMLLPKMFAEIGIDPVTAYKLQRDIIIGFVDLLFYNFRYRQFTPQSLELMIEAFFAGFKIGQG